LTSTKSSHDSPRRVVLHVGLHKTGTTTIQTALARGGDFVYPTPGAQGPGHADLARSAFGNVRSAGAPDLVWRLVADLDRTTPPELPVVLSSEAFDGALRTERHAQVLRMLADRFPTELIITIRPDDERVTSVAAQLIVSGQAIDLTNYWTQVASNPSMQKGVVPKWLGLASWSEVHIVRTETSSPDHVFRSFESIIGADIQRVEPQNTRWPRMALVVLNELNHTVNQSLSPAERRQLAQQATERITRTAPDVNERQLDAPPDSVLEPLRARWHLELDEIRALAATGRLRLYEPTTSTIDEVSGRHPDLPRSLHATPVRTTDRRPEAPPSSGTANAIRPLDLVLHVGPPKTGTSALQWFFAQNAAALRRIGLWYPERDGFAAAKRDEVASGNGYSLANKIAGISALAGEDFRRRQSQIRDMLTEFRHEAQGHPDVGAALLSSEYFGALSTADLRIFNSLAAPLFGAVRILAVHRDPVTLLCSGYSQSIKGAAGNTQSLEERWARDGAAHLLGRLSTPLRYADAFGDTHVSVVPYVSPGIDPSGLIRAVLKTVSGSDITAVEAFLQDEGVVLAKGPVHRSLGPVGRELVRLCSVEGTHRTVVAQLYSAIDRATPSDVQFEVDIPDDLRLDVLNATRSTIEEIAARLCPEVGADLGVATERASEEGWAHDPAVGRMHDEMRWVLQGVAHTLSSLGAGQGPALRRTLQPGASPTGWPHALRRLRRHRAVKSAASLLPDGLRAASNRYLDRMILHRSAST
jgi:hypothetical protein